MLAAATRTIAADARGALSDILSSVQDTTYLVAKTTTVSNPLTTAGASGLYISVAAVIPDNMDNYTLAAGPPPATVNSSLQAAAAGQAVLQMPRTFSAAYTGSAELLLPYLQYFADPVLFTATKQGPLLSQPGILEAFAVTGVGRAGLITAQSGPFTTEASGSLCQTDDSNPHCDVKLLLPTTRALNPALPTQCLQYQPAAGTFNLVSAASAEIVVDGQGKGYVQCSISKPGLYLAQQSSNSNLPTVGAETNSTVNDTAVAAPAMPQPSSSPPPQLGQASSGSSSSSDLGDSRKVRGSTIHQGHGCFKLMKEQNFIPMIWIIISE